MPRLSSACLVLFACVSSLVAQHEWVPLHAAGQIGVGVLQSPLPPWVLTTLPAPFSAASTSHTLRAGALRRRVDVLPPEIGIAQAAVFDELQQRIVAWCTDGSTSSVCTFDGARWSVLPPTPNGPLARVAPALGYDQVVGKVMLFGGALPGSFGQPLGDLWRLDGDTWTRMLPAAPTPPPRKNGRFAMGVVPGGFQLLLFGGNGQFGTNPAIYNDTWSWNGAAWTEHLPATRPSTREGCALAFDAASGQTLLYGGFVLGAPPYLGDAWAWTGTDWAALPAPTPTPLSAPMLLHDGAGLVLLGGSGSGVSAYAWQGGAWAPVLQDPNLRQTYAEAAAFDTNRNEIVRFGGRDLYGATNGNDTWLWDGVWRAAATATAPAPRQGAAMAYDPLRDEVVLFGGHDGSTFFADTWRWSGATWTQATPAVSPPKRARAAMAWDPSLGRIVLHGGDDAFVKSNDSWQWDGTNWSPLPTAVAPVLGDVTLAFDSVRSVLALYVGHGAGVPGDLYERQAPGWVQVSNTAPSYASLYFDPATGTLVALGSVTGAEWVAGAWVPRAQARYGAAPIVTDPQRGGMLAAGVTVAQSTPTPATTSVYGTGCGPQGDVTCSFDRVPGFDAPTTAFVRTWDPGTPTFLFLGLSQVGIPYGGPGCSVYLDTLLGNVAVLAAPSGWAGFDLQIPAVPGTAGVDVFVQAVTWYGGPLGFSNGVAMRLGI